MLSKKEVERFVNNMAPCILSNFVATFIISVFAFNRAIEISFLISFIGPILLAGCSVIFIAIWYVYRWIKDKRKKNG